MVLHSLRLMESNLFVRATGFWNPGNFGLWNSESEKKCLWNPEYSSGNLYSHLNASLGIQNPSFTDKDWNPVPGIRNPPHGIQNPRLFWIPLRGANPLSFTNRPFVLKGHLTTFLWKWKLWFCLRKTISGLYLKQNNVIIVIWFFKPAPFS